MDVVRPVIRSGFLHDSTSSEQGIADRLAAHDSAVERLGECFGAGITDGPVGADEVGDPAA